MMSRLIRDNKKRDDGVNIIWGFGDHYLKENRGQATYYICTSNDMTKAEELIFYSNGVHLKIGKEVALGLKKLKLIK
jgi:hypothetical protein